MNRQEIKDVFKHFEQKYPVTQWNINGTDMWPIIRFILSFQLLNKVEDLIHYERKKQSRTDKVRLIGQSFFYTLTFVFRKYQKSDILFISHKTFLHKTDRGLENKFFSYLQSILKTANKATYQVIPFDHNSPTDQLYPLKRLFYFYSICRRVINFSNNINLPLYKEFIQELKEKSGLNGIPEKKLLIFQRDVSTYSNIYALLFKKIKPLIVITSCYYSFNNFGLNNSA
jgi:hypothetical protein